jgi:hypothetical protein
MFPSEFLELDVDTSEIEITPEMLEAGLAIVWRSPIDCPTEDDMRLMLTRLFTAMSKVRLESHSSNCEPGRSISARPR